MESHRFIYSKDYDVDAYLLEDKSFGLFLTLKNSKLEKSFSETISHIKKDFKNPVSLVGGALKTPVHSKPLELKNPDAWCKDSKFFFKLKFSDVLNPGLFLDQSKNKQKLMSYLESSMHSCLNLFSYTGSFSVFAQGAGLETTSVDISSHYLAWEKENMLKNFEKPNFHLIKEDAKKFLKKTKKKYSVIIIDPPSFSRGKTTMEVKKDLPKMAERAFEILEPQGILFVSTNLKTWKEKDFETAIKSVGKIKHFERGITAPGFPKDHGLKSAFLFK